MQDIYRELCNKEQDIPIYAKDWWMDAVCGKENWNVVVIKRNDEIIATLPYFVKGKMGISHITQPVMTQNNGMWIKYPGNQKIHKKLAFEKKILNEIIDQINRLKVDFYLQNYPVNIQYLLPFYWNGFSNELKYTYTLDNIKNLDDVYDGFDSKLKNQIRKAEKNVTIKSDGDVELFYKINKMTFDRQGVSMPYSFEFISKLDEKCAKNNCRKILYAQDDRGNIHSVAYLVWDKNSAYYIAGGQNTDFKNSESVSLLLWECIKFASTVVDRFDFEGSMMENIERFFRSFNAKPMPYYTVKKICSENKGKRLLLKARNFLRG